MDAARASARRRFYQGLAARIGQTADELEQTLEPQLLDLLDELPEGPGTGANTIHYVTIEDAEDAEERGLYRMGREPRQLTNFRIRIERDIEIEDELRPERRFEGSIVLGGEMCQFSITADDFANNTKLEAAIYTAAGPKARILCRTSEMRRAISSVSTTASRQRISPNFGWAASLDRYQFPRGAITASGYVPYDESTGVRIDLANEERARYLDLRPPDDHIADVKRHIVQELLQLHGPTVMGCLIATVPLAILHRFVAGTARFALWMTGLTGSGKSFAAKLAQNFFGDFPLESGGFVTWASTSNYIQRQGYYFRDAIYVVDDYKPEVIHQREIVKILQAYGDSTSRGRLNADASTKASREIRGLLVSTGEDVPEHSASSIARSIIVVVPQREKDLARGRRCVQMRQHYSSVTADFIRHLLSDNRIPQFVRRVDELRQQYHADIAGQQNDARIAGNFAMLAAAYEEFLVYLADVWPEAEQARQEFVEVEIIGIRDQMLGMVREQQASEVFLSTLWALIEHDHVAIEGRRVRYGIADNPAGKRLIGRRAPQDGRSHFGTALPTPDDPVVLEICTSLALEAVQESIRRQGKPKLDVTERALLDQLAQAGLLLDSHNHPITSDQQGRRTRVARFGNDRRNVFRISQAALQGCATSAIGVVSG